MPKRLTKSRRKGYRRPDNSRYVGRPTMFGNPFTMQRFGHAKSVILHRAWLNGQLGDLTLEKLQFCPAKIEALHRLRRRVLDNLHTLIGLDLVCWCPQTSDWCHATTLLEMAAKLETVEQVAA